MVENQILLKFKKKIGDRFSLLIKEGMRKALCQVTPGLNNLNRVSPEPEAGGHVDQHLENLLE